MHEIISHAQLFLIDVAKDNLELLVLCKALNEWLDTFVSTQTRQVVGSPQLLKQILIRFVAWLEYVVELPILDVHVYFLSFSIFRIHCTACAELEEASTLLTAFIDGFQVCVPHLSVVFQDSRHHVQKLNTFIRRLQVESFVHEVDL